MDARAPRVTQAVRVRAFIAIAGIVSLGMPIAACSGPSEPTPEKAGPSRTATPLLSPPSTGGMSWLRVSPEQGAPGSAVSLDVACLDKLGAVLSPVLTIGALKGNPDGHQPWHLFGAGTIRSDTVPGRYKVSATCGAVELSTAFTVVPAT
jgi:hypothetical protein